MDWSALQTWLTTADQKQIGVVLIVSMMVFVAIGVGLRRLRGDRKEEGDEGQEGYIVSGVLGLLALLMGFTFSLAVDRFETRRVLVLSEANAIGTTYLRAQLLEQPHRERMTDLLTRYTANRIELASARNDDDRRRLLAINDNLITDIWTATVASFPSIKGLDFSSAYVDSVKEVIEMDATRKAARRARVPPAVSAVLFVYLITTAGVLGYVLRGLRGQISAAFLLVLTSMALLLIIDIDRPGGGRIVEDQGPMIELQKSLKRWPPAVFDRWSGGEPAAPAPARP